MERNSEYCLNKQNILNLPNEQDDDFKLKVKTHLEQVRNFLTYLELIRMKTKREEIKIEPEFVSRIMAFMDYIENKLNLNPDVVSAIRDLIRVELQNYITIFERLKRLQIELKKILLNSPIIH